MSFTLVIVVHPDRQKTMEVATWSSFQAHAKLDSLKKVAGVFYINDTAWIFDTRKSLPEYALVVHKANEFHVQLFSFQFDSESLQSHVVPCPRSEKLEAFLAS